jgi:hypothetical protein
MANALVLKKRFFERSPKESALHCIQVETAKLMRWRQTEKHSAQYRNHRGEREYAQIHGEVGHLWETALTVCGKHACTSLSQCDAECAADDCQQHAFGQQLHDERGAMHPAQSGRQIPSFGPPRAKAATSLHWRKRSKKTNPTAAERISSIERTFATRFC